MSLSALSDARHLGHDVLINATGAGPKYLSDVQDKEMELLRGQMMIVKSDYKKYFMRDNGKEYTYVIPRLDGTVVLGGIRHKDVLYVMNSCSYSDRSVTNTALRIVTKRWMRRSIRT